MTERIQAVIFDLDGVLIDSELYYMKRLRQFVQDSFGRIIPEEELLSIVGASGPAHWLAARPYLPEGWEREDYQAAYRAYLAKYPIQYQQLCFPNVISVMQKLKKDGYRMSLATSSPADKVAEVMRDCGFGPYLEMALTREDVERSKPDPEIYQKSLERLGLSASQCLVVEDSAIGIKAAVEAGILVAARRETRYRVDQSGADYILGSFGELPDLLRRMNGKTQKQTKQS